MKHLDPDTVKDAAPLETRNAPDDTKATSELLEQASADVKEMRTAFDAGMSKMEADAKAASDALEKRMAELETKLNRPGTVPAQVKNGEDTIERRAFNHLLRHGETDMPLELRDALVKGTDTKGGFLVHPDFESQLTKDVQEISPVRQVARVTSIGSGSLIIPTLASRPTAQWVTETQERTEEGPTFGQVTIEAHEMSRPVEISNQMLEDAKVDIEAEVRLLIAEAFATAEGAAFINGTGTGRPKGFLHGASTIPTALSGNAAEITSDGLIAMFYGMKAAYRQRGSWMMNSDALGKIRTLKDGQGNYLWRPGIAEGQPETILGRPVYDTPDMPDTAANAFPIAFGDWQRGYRIVDRVGVSILRDPYTKASTGLTVFHARRRVGGAPTLAEAMTKMKIAAS